MDIKSRNALFVVTGAILLAPSILILHNLNYYRSLLLYKEAYTLFLLYLLSPVLFYFLLRLLRFKNMRAAFITLCFSVFYFFFGAIQDFFLQYSFTFYLGKTYVLLGFFSLLFAYLLFKKPQVSRSLFFLAVIGFCFFLTEVALLLFHFKNFSERATLLEKVALRNNINTTNPINIHHIILDGYTNSKTLKTEFGFENKLDSFLKTRNFFVAAHSKSNYNFTPYSLAATLHMHYLNVQGKNLERNYKNYFSGNQLYADNPVFRFFKQQGYNLHTFSILEDYDHLDKLGTFVPKTPVYSIRNQTLERVLLNPWLWKKLQGSAESRLPEKIKKNLHYYADYNKKACENVLSASSQNKVYSFTHFLLPHEPYVFQKSFIDSLTEADVMNHKEGYPKQVQYVNGLLEKIVTELQKNKNNIIIIQGDHGFRDYDLTKTPVITQFETFNAFYFPGQNYSSLNDSISLVNTYRLVMTQHFSQKLPVLEDRYFIPPK